MIERLQILQANKGQFKNNNELSLKLKADAQFKQEITSLARIYLNRSISGCGNCYADAYFELIHLDIKKAMEKEACKFRLFAGALLRDRNGDMSKLCSNHNITNELALYHLSTNPNCKSSFQEVPENLDELLQEFNSPIAEEEKVINEIKEPVQEETKQKRKSKKA